MTGLEIMTLEGHTRQVTFAAYSPDGQRIVSGSWDGTIEGVGRNDWPGSNDSRRAHSPSNVCGLQPGRAEDREWLLGDKTLKVWDATTLARK